MSCVKPIVWYSSALLWALVHSSIRWPYVHPLGDLSEPRSQQPPELHPRFKPKLLLAYLVWSTFLSLFNIMLNYILVPTTWPSSSLFIELLCENESVDISIVARHIFLEKCFVLNNGSK